MNETKKQLSQFLEDICAEFNNISPAEDGIDCEITLTLTNGNMELKRAINTKIGLIILDKYLIFQTKG